MLLLMSVLSCVPVVLVLLMMVFIVVLVLLLSVFYVGGVDCDDAGSVVYAGVGFS